MAYQKLQVSRALAVTPSDDDFIMLSENSQFSGGPCTLYVGTGGTVVVLTAGGDLATFLNVANGSFMPVQVVKVMEATTAEDILALW
jgi:hypothetical protein